MYSYPPTVCLDGNAVRRIREEKRLTQLYVAKVVGVTTDTISRWENNRYPTVRRENLFKLAEALESPAEFLVLSEETTSEGGGGDEVHENVELVRASESGFQLNRSHYIVAAVVLPLIAGMFIYQFFSKSVVPPSSISTDFTATRILPHYAAPGVVIPIRLRLKVDDATKRYIIREHFPPGWEIIEASPPASSIDNQDGMARWIVKQGEEHPMIAYLVRVDSRSPQGMIARFYGEVIANLDDKKQSLSIAGETEMVVAPYNWSDLNGDSVIDDTEMLEASQAFEDLEGVHLEWKELERLWDAGYYRFDSSTRHFIPSKIEPKVPPGRSK